MTSDANPGPREVAPLPSRRTGAAIASYALGRCCARPECTTTLSRYNASALCYPHGELERLRRPQ